MNKKRISICFYGQVRDYGILNNLYSSWIDNNNYFDIDFFICSWEDFDTSRILLPFKGQSYFDWETLNKTYKNTIERITEEGLNKNENTLRMSFLIQEVHRLKRKYEKENNFAYDFNILVRPDYYLNKNTTFNNINELYQANLHKYKKPLVSLLSPIIVKRDTLELDQDCVFIENNTGFDMHSKMKSIIFDSTDIFKLPIRFINGSHNSMAALFFYYNFFTVVQKNKYDIIKSEIR